VARCPTLILLPSSLSLLSQPPTATTGEAPTRRGEAQAALARLKAEVDAVRDAGGAVPDEDAVAAAPEYREGVEVRALGVWCICVFFWGGGVSFFYLFLI
jgi:hypothetical protein